MTSLEDAHILLLGEQELVADLYRVSVIPSILLVFRLLTCSFEPLMPGRFKVRVNRRKMDRASYLGGHEYLSFFPQITLLMKLLPVLEDVSSLVVPSIKSTSIWMCPKRNAMTF